MVDLTAKMNASPDAALLRAVRDYAQFVAVGTALTGLVVLVGWAFDVQWLKTMKANTALAFVLAGFSLWLLHPDRMQPWQQLLGRACSVVPLLVGGLTLAEYFANWDLGIDQLLFRGDVSTVAAAAPGRPSPIAAVELVIFAMGLLSLRTGPAGDCRTSQVHASIAVAIGVLGFLAHLYGATLVRVNPAYTSMTLHTSITILFFSTALLVARAEAGPMRLLVLDSPGGLLARRLIPTVLVSSATVGWLRLWAQANGWIDTEFGVVVTVTVVSAFVIVATVVAARATDKIDRQRRRAVEVQREGSRAFEIARQRLALALHAGDIGVWDWDVRTNQIVWDAHMYEIYGVTPGAPVVYTTWSTAVLPEDLAKAEETLQQTIAAKTSSDNYFRIRHPQRGIRHIEASEGVLVDEEGKVARVVGVNRDVTGQKTLTLELASTVKELEAFSYSVAHDLRAPLRHISGFGKLLARRHANEMSADAQDLLAQICTASAHMDRLIEDLLVLSKVTRRPMQSEALDLSAMAHAVATRLQERSPEQKVEFVIQPHLKATGDGRLVEVALENLLGNAFKYTGKREQARIEFGALHEGETSAFFVRDNGAGFDMAYVDRLFRAFERLHDAQDFEGTGIGLVTVQRIVERHGGTVRAEGRPGEGATFYFTLG